MHQAHGKSLCNKTGPPGSDDINPFRLQKFREKFFDIIVRNGICNGPDP
jgi:hypothetical protein